MIGKEEYIDVHVPLGSGKDRHITHHEWTQKLKYHCSFQVSAEQFRSDEASASPCPLLCSTSQMDRPRRLNRAALESPALRASTGSPPASRASAEFPWACRLDPVRRHVARVMRASIGSPHLYARAWIPSSLQRGWIPFVSLAAADPFVWGTVFSRRRQHIARPSQVTLLGWHKQPS